MAKVRGSFSGVSGVATIAEVPEESTLEIEIDANTIDTKDANRDAHLRSNDFFGVEDHPDHQLPQHRHPARQGRERVAGRRRPHHQGHHPPGHRRPRVPRRRHRPLGQPAHRLLGRRPRGQPGGLGPDLERPPGDGRVPAVQVGPPGDRGRAGPQVTSTCGTSAGARGFPPGRRPIARDMLAEPDVDRAVVAAATRPIAAPLERCAEFLGADEATVRKAAAHVEPYVPTETGLRRRRRVSSFPGTRRRGS